MKMKHKCSHLLYSSLQGLNRKKTVFERRWYTLRKREGGNVLRMIHFITSMPSFIHNLVTGKMHDLWDRYIVFSRWDTNSTTEKKWLIRYVNAYSSLRKWSCLNLVKDSKVVANQQEAKSGILYCHAAKGHSKPIGTHEHHLNTFISHENILLNSSEVDICKENTLQYVGRRMKLSKKPHAAGEPWADHPDLA